MAGYVYHIAHSMASNKRFVKNGCNITWRYWNQQKIELKANTLTLLQLMSSC